MTVSFFGSFFFLKNPLFRPSFETPLPQPRFFLDQNSDLSLDYNLEYKLAKSCLYDKALESTIYGFKKSQCLAKTQEEASKAHYGLIYTYFLSKKWDELKHDYLRGGLDSLDQKAPYYKDALLMCYIALCELKVPFLTQDVKNKLCEDRALAQIILDYESLEKGNYPKRYQDIYAKFLSLKKSPLKAGLLNAFLPGSGYLYLNQKQSAITAFLLLGLLCFCLFVLSKQKQIAFSLLIYSIFTGFYWGSIVGVTESCQFYNKTIHGYLFDPIMNQDKLFLELHIDYAP
jgi:hypothetical protein